MPPTTRENCIILLVDAPVPERVNPRLAGAFGAERAVHIHLDLLQNAYRLVKNFGQALVLLAYEKSARHPDLTWLDADDPGFLDTRGKAPGAGIPGVFRLAFNTGAKKVLLLNHLSPGVRSEWLQQAFDSVSEKAIALGPNRDGSVYLVGMTLSGLKLMEGSPFASEKAVEELSEKAKKAKLSVSLLPEAGMVDSEESLREWLGTKDHAKPLFPKEAAVAAPAALPERRHRRRHTPPAQPPLPGTTEQQL